MPVEGACLISAGNTPSLSQEPMQRHPITKLDPKDRTLRTFRLNVEVDDLVGFFIIDKRTRRRTDTSGVVVEVFDRRLTGGTRVQVGSTIHDVSHFAIMTWEKGV